MPTASAPLRLATVTHFFPAHGGGLERVAQQLVERFAREGMRVDWFSSDTDPPPQNLPAQVSHRPVAATNIIEELTQLPYPLWSPAALPRLWKSIGSADVVHIHEHLYFSSLLALAIARLRGRPVVITQHMGALDFRNRAVTKLYETGARLLAHMTFSAASRQVFISANVRQFFQQDRSPTARLIFNGIDAGRFRAVGRTERRILRQQLAFPPGRPAVLFVGRFVRKKGFRIMRPLAARLPAILWVFAGSGPEDPSQWGLPNVRAAGRLDHDALPAYYQAADLLILPSSGEGFPLVVQEALACGLGVLSTEEVANACPAARCMIRTCPTPRADPDIELWERALQSALCDKTYLGARDDRSRQATALWSWDRCATEYMRLFEEIAGCQR